MSLHWSTVSQLGSYFSWDGIRSYGGLLTYIKIQFRCSRSHLNVLGQHLWKEIGKFWVMWFALKIIQRLLSLTDIVVNDMWYNRFFTTNQDRPRLNQKPFIWFPVCPKIQVRLTTQSVYFSEANQHNMQNTNRSANFLGIESLRHDYDLFHQIKNFTHISIKSHSCIIYFYILFSIKNTACLTHQPLKSNSLECKFCHVS